MFYGFEGLISPLLIIVVFLGMAALAIVRWRSNKKRRINIEAFALKNNLSFSPGQSTIIDVRFPNFSCFNRGHSRWAYNMMSGTYKDRESLLFDYHYAVTTHSRHGSHTQHYYFSAVIITADLFLKSLFIRPENFLDKITEFIGLDDIDFESAEFSHKFYVKANDRKFAYAVIHQGMMDFLLANQGYSIQIDANHILLYKNKLFSPMDEFGGCLDIGIGFLNLLPEYLVREFKGQMKPELTERSERKFDG